MEKYEKVGYSLLGIIALAYIAITSICMIELSEAGLAMTNP